MRIIVRILIVVLSVLAFVGANAGPDLGVTVGLRIGGEMTNDLTGSNPGLDASPTLGLLLSWELQADRFVELVWSHEQTEFEIDDLYPGDDTFGMGIGHLYFAGVYRPQRAPGRTRPFVTAGAGLTYFLAEPSGFGSDVGLMVMVGGGGVKPLSERWSLRFEGRVYGTFANVSFSGLCGGVGCSFNLSGSGMIQFEFAVGGVYDF